MNEPYITDAESIAREVGLVNVTRRNLCEFLGMPVGSFQHFFGGTFGNLVATLRSRGVCDGIPIDRKRFNRTDVLRAAILTVATTHGYDKITRKQIAEYAGVSRALVTWYFGSMREIRDMIVTYAIDNSILEVIAYGIVIRDTRILRAPKTLKEKALRILYNR